LGSYQTPLLNRDKERIDNIRLAIRKINGYKLKPDEIFSFNKTVGKRDAANGFKVAAVIINGEYGEDMGGGVCQLSSTIFNAADKAGMQIVERHSHSRAVRYVPEGRDAAVSYDYLDFKFKNNKSYTVEVKAAIEGAKLRVSIYRAK
jgi:vancomycin resistance protein YoaR